MKEPTFHFLYWLLSAPSHPFTDCVCLQLKPYVSYKAPLIKGSILSATDIAAVSSSASSS